MDEKPLILCVDDDPKVLAGLARTLHSRYRVRTAEGGAEGLRCFQLEGPFRSVISDYHMAPVDGITFLRWIRELSPGTPRLLLTGYMDLETAMAAVNEAGVFRLLEKPCSQHALLRALEAAVAVSQSTRGDGEKSSGPIPPAS